MNFRYDKEEEKLIISQASRIEYHQIKIWLERFVKGYRYMPAFKMGVWNGKNSYFEDGKVRLGLWRECFKACKEIGVTFNIENREDFPLNREVTIDSVKDFCKEYFKKHKIKNQDGEWIDFMPYDYQIETAYKILKNRYCLASVATSGGKSLIICIVYFYVLKYIDPDAKMLLIVPSILLVTQFTDSIYEFNYGLNYLHKWQSQVDFQSGNVELIKSEDPEYDPFSVRIEEVMSERPRKWSGPNQPNIYIGTYQSLGKYPKEFFQQFHTVVCDEAHQSKAVTLKSILSKTFKIAYYRFGVSGTFPSEDSSEILTIQSVLGPIITEVTANELVKLGTITPMQIKTVIMNHNDKEVGDKLIQAKKMGAGKEVFQYEKDYIQASEKRLEFIKKIVAKCDKNTLLLFHTIEYGQKIFEKLSSELPDKEFYYIDGTVSGKKRGEIKNQLESSMKVEYTILNFGSFEIDIESDFKIPLSNGEFKIASEITSDDDIDDFFIKEMKRKQNK